MWGHVGKGVIVRGKQIFIMGWCIVVSNRIRGRDKTSSGTVIHGGEWGHLWGVTRCPTGGEWSSRGGGGMGGR